MNLGALARNQRRLIMVFAVGLAMLGAFSALWMPRQEDPTFPARFAVAVVAFPGADPATIENRILEPLEESLEDVPEIDWVMSTARRDVGVVRLQLLDSVYATDAVWDDVRRRLEDAEGQWPEGVAHWELQDNLVELQSVLVAVRAPGERLRAEAADTLADALLDVPGALRVERSGDIEEQIVVGLSSAASHRYALPAGALASHLSAHTRPVPAGALATGGMALPLDPRSQLDSVAELAALPIPVAGGVVPLSDLAQVERQRVTPIDERVRLDGEEVVLLGVVPAPNIDVVEFGEQIRDVIATTDLPADAAIVVDQPKRVEARLADLAWSLVQGVAIVGGVLFVAMGLRLGLVVASIVPLVTLSSLALYAAVGGTLQQISVAGLVLALGLLVDNGIVVAERVQWRIDHGEDPETAAATTVQELALPLLSATGTTIAAFVPLLLSEGGAADFTRAIPQLVVVTLIVSLVVALTVTPALGAWVFRRSSEEVPTTPTWRRALSALPVRHPLAMTGLGMALVAASMSLAPLLDQQFFPSTDRNQLLVEIELPDAAHLDTTDEVARHIEDTLVGREDVVSVLSFVGRSAPRFYYNIPNSPAVPRLAQLLVTTTHVDDVPAIQAAVDLAAVERPDARITASRLEQGPPLEAPVEFRLYGDDLDNLWQASTTLVAELRQVSGLVEPHQSLSAGVPTLQVQPADAALARSSVTRRDVALAMLSHTRGLPGGSLRLGSDDVDVVVRAPAGERITPTEASQIDVWSAAGPVPLGSLAQVETVVKPAQIVRRNGQRMVTVTAKLAPGRTFSDVIAPARSAAERITADRGLGLELGGELEGSGQANGAVFVAAPIGAAMLVGFLLAQFQSFRRVLVILVTVPLAAAGVVPGLLIFDQPFGFTSLLGVFALIGIVVNNAIILVDYMDARRDAGLSLEDAVREAVEVRWRPILLTTATTIAGMLPLLVSSSTLWPPLASSLISGLLGSTVLTLFVVPALLVLMLGEGGPRLPRGAVAALMLVFAGRAVAAPVTLDQVLDAADSSRTAQMLDASTQADVAAARMPTARLLPKLGVVGSFTENQAALVLDPGAGVDLPDPLMPSDLEPLFAAFEDPAQVDAVFDAVRAEEGEPPELAFDSITVRRKRFLDAGVQLSVPLVDPQGIALMGTVAPSIATAHASADASRADLRLGAVEAFYGLWLAEQSLDVARQGHARAQEVRKAADARIDAGVERAIAGLQARMAVEEAMAAIATAQASVTGARLTLERLTGLTDVDPVLPATPRESEGADMARHPRQVQARSQALAARRLQTATALGWAPTLEGSFQASVTQNQGFQDTPGYWVASVTARWTLFDGGQTAIRSAEHRRRAAVAALSEEQTRQELDHAVQVATARVTATTASLQAATRSVELAAEAHRLSNEAWTQGVGTWQELRDAELAWTRAQLGAAEAIRQHHLARHRLAHARGEL